MNSILSLRGARRALLLVSLAGLAASATSVAWAQTVVITGSREALAPERLAADVAVIDAQTIRDTRADSLADLLRREAGLQLSRNGGPGQSTGLFMRGAASQQSLVLVDGVRVGSATLGYASVEALGLAQLDRIEVLRGPGSSLYGADAVGGVVNLITRRGQGAMQLDARLALGGLGAKEASAGVRGSSGAWDYAASLSHEQAQGVSALRAGDAFGNHNPDRDGFKLDAAQIGLGFKPASGHRVGLTLLHTRLNSQYDASEFLPPNYAQDASPDFRSRLRTEVAALDWRGQLTSNVSGSARISNSIDDASSGGTETDHFRTQRRLLGAQLAWRATPLGQWVVAMEHQQDDATSSSYISGVQRRNDALALELTGSAAAWSWQADARRDDSSDFGAVNSARLGGSVVLAPGLRLRALAANSFRAPSFNDLYYPGYGVATLQPERGRSVEAALVWRAADSQVTATWHHNAVRDLVAFESNPAKCPDPVVYSFGCAANINRALLEGLSLGASQRLGAWSFRTQIDWLKARDHNSGAKLARRASQQATVSADWTAGDWSAGASLLHLGQRPDGGKTLAAETTVDISATWRLAPAVSLQAKLNNASNRSTEPARDYQGQGRQAWLVLRYEPQP